MIQWNREWFTLWLADHPPPPGVEPARWVDYSEMVEDE